MCWKQFFHHRKQLKIYLVGWINRLIPHVDMLQIFASSQDPSNWQLYVYFSRDVFSWKYSDRQWKLSELLNPFWKWFYKDLKNENTHLTLLSHFVNMLLSNVNYDHHCSNCIAAMKSTWVTLATQSCLMAHWWLRIYWTLMWVCMSAWPRVPLVKPCPVLPRCTTRKQKASHKLLLA